MEQSQRAIEILQGQGWSREQAIGIAANLQHESNFNPGAVGDGGKAYGIAQWHPDRQAAFQAQYGKSIRGSSLEEQLAFLTHEMRDGNEKAAGKRLMAATDPAEAASIVSRFYERPADTEGEAQRRAASAAKLAGIPFVPAAQGAALPTARTLAPGDTTGWPVLPTARAAMTAAGSDAGIDKAAILGNSQAQMLQANQSAPQSRAEFDRAIQLQNEMQAKKDATGFVAAFDAARHDPRIQATFNLLDKIDAFGGEADEVPPGWSYDSVRDKVEAGRPDEEREYLRENGTSPAALARAEAQLKYRRDLDETYGYAGGFASFAGQMAGGLLDPVSLIAGLGVGKALSLAGVGSQALARAGQVAAARASFIGENVAGNVLIEGMQDAMGEVKGSGDYAMAAATGAVMGTPFLPFIHPVVSEVDEALIGAAEGIKRAAVKQQADAVGEGLMAGKTPEQAARDAVKAEVDAILGETHQPPGKRDAAIPTEAQESLRQEVDGTRPPDMEEPAPAAPVDVEPQVPVVDKPAPDRTPEQTAAYVQDAAKGSAEATIGVTKEGDEVRFGWKKDPARKPGKDSLRDTLTELSTSDALPESLRSVAGYILKVAAPETLDGVTVRLSYLRPGQRQGGKFMSGEGIIDVAADMKAKEREGLTAGQVIKQMPEYTQKAAIHETMHAVTTVKLLAYQEGKAPKDVAAAAQQLEEVFARYKEQVKGTEVWAQKYAAKNIHEFVAQLWTETEVQQVLAAMPGGTGEKGSAWTKVLKAFTRILFGDGARTKGNALADAMRLTDTIIRASGPVYRDANGAPVFASTLPPQVLSNARLKRLQQIVNHAMGYMAKNPIDAAKLDTLTKYAAKWGGLSDGLVLARDENPVSQMVASLVAETTTGAAGRKATVAIRARTLEQKLMGNGLLDYQNARAQWHKANGTTAKDRIINGEGDRAFGKLVMEEIHRRRDPAYNSAGTDPNVVRAADALEAGFQRARDEQVAAGTLGSDHLAASSRGYIPQALDGAKLAALSEDAAAYEAFRAALSNQFQNLLGFDRKFSEAFSMHYLERVRRRAMGDKSMDALAAQGDGMQVVRDTLQEMGQDPNMRDRAAAAQAHIGQGHTKKRLDLDLLEPFGQGTLMDLYVTDPVALYRRYMRGVSGNIALTESGILGIHGVRELISAAITPFPGVKPASDAAMDAMGRVFAEILGTPVAGEVISAGATNFGLLVGLQRLGGLVFTQANEAWNMIHHVGLAATLKGVASLPRLIGEVRESYKTGAANNPLLKSLEVYGGEIGMEGYKMVMPLDAPDARVSQYMEQPSVLTRLLRAGGHVQAVATGFRALLAAQHRMAAEQITMKALRMIRDGGSSKALADMGFTPDVVNGMRAVLPQVAQWDQSGRLVRFDVSQVADPYVAEGFVQAVHRGTAQIIQGTFAGERNAWVHNDYLRLLTQLRSFGMTAMEKQWSRTRMNQGFYTAAAMMFVQMGMALPLHLARVQLAAAGREDRKQYLKDNTNPAALIRATMSYASLSGLTGDMLEAVTGIAGAWGDQATKEMLGARQGASGVGRVIPAAGTIDQAIRVASGKADLHTALKQLPFSSIWYLQPLLNLTKENR